MFAPQQYPGIPGPPYCQYIPNPFMTPQIPSMIPNMQQDTGEKRNWSPNTNTSPSTLNEEKRKRNESGDLENRESSGPDEKKEPTMTDLKTYMDAIMARLNTTATKIDISSLNDRISAQNIEIEQIKVKMQKHDDEMKNLQTIIDEEVAASLSRKLQTADGGTRMTTNNMAANGNDRSQNTTSTRRNLIIEGLKGESDDEMCSELIRICAVIKITVYRRDIENIVRYKRCDETSTKPGPVNVTVSRIGLCDTILRKKNGLKDNDDTQGIYINADESFEVRKAKSTLRKVSKMGLPIEIRHDRIQVDNIWYTTSDIEKIPVKYMPLVEDDLGATGGAVGGESQPMKDKRDEQSTKDKLPSKTLTSPGKRRLIYRGEKMRITKAGLVFSGPTAYISNMSYAPITVDDIPHDTNEEAYQYKKAKTHGCDGLAEALKEMENVYKIRKEGGGHYYNRRMEGKCPL